MNRLATALFVLLLITLPVQVSSNDNVNQVLPLDEEVKLINWEKVSEMIPRKAIFTIVDVESGKSFQVQRRAGSRHADIQPLTNKDTKVMKEIYPEWSWKRRAAIAVVDGQMIAASMNGMPHGAGALDNGFNGHFCLHFLNSTTHGSPSPDPAHNLMVLKAAGKIDEYLSKQNPSELVDSLMIAINNTDTTVLRKIVPHEQVDLQALSGIHITNWKVIKNKRSKKNLFLNEVEAKVEIYIEESGTITTVINLPAKRDPLSSRWRVDISALLRIANQS
ncbi:hypothetical protein [Pseudalkalibacillus hwajinpoensis]|uniref:Uncharacterized protein n=1 Tax=Guptibacillus hwajinpoensis TaxID=208199 RepID=A0A4U1MMP1_9BACL|nr:hypothetical protein [Pseudalkalibacillus hwajinpoensis]TKD71842.1 hypothetical protein FBF83_03310 [Pseudalkalibacillus hwajinpoensis]